MSSLDKLFSDDQTGRIVVDGVPLHALLRLRTVRSFRIDLISVNTRVPQAVLIKGDNASLLCNGVLAKRMVIGWNGAPLSAIVEVLPLGKTREGGVSLWNEWWVGQNRHAWLGNAAMRLHSSNAGWICECSDGVGPLDLGNLVFAVREVVSDEVETLQGDTTSLS